MRDPVPLERVRLREPRVRAPAGLAEICSEDAHARASHALGKSVIAEGVETQKQLAVLRRLGCDEMQGFLLSAALPPEGVGQLVRARSLALQLS